MYPSIWKISKMIAIPKKENPTYSGFRYYICSLSKALEYIQRCSHLNSCNMFHKYKSGFRSKHITALLNRYCR